MVVASGASQTTFYPLMASPSVQRSLAATVGKVDYNRERRFYEIICDLLLGDLPGGQPGLFELGSAWTFNRRGTGAAGEDAMIDEYVVDYEEYPAIGVRRHHLSGREFVREHVLGARVQRRPSRRGTCP